MFRKNVSPRARVCVSHALEEEGTFFMELGKQKNSPHSLWRLGPFPFYVGNYHLSQAGYI